MVTFKHKGDFRKTKKFFNRAPEASSSIDLDRYGREGVAALSAATPVETGKTASSWYYEITRSRGSFSIRWLNSYVEDGVVIAIIIQYGHGTGTGGYVQGRDYINPAIRPIFDQIRNDLWKEVTSL